MKLFSIQAALLLFASFGVAFTPLYAQSLYTPVTNHYTVNQGLSQNTVHDITQDSEGYIWISTRAGLNRFDGYNFTTYLNDPDDSNSLSSSFIWVSLEDQNQNLWVGTSGGGLNLLDRETGNFHEFTTDSENPSSISFNTITALFEDSSGNLWIGTEGGGLNRLEGLQSTAEGYSASFDRFLGNHHEDDNYRGDIVMGIAEDSDGVIWVATYGDGVYRFDEDGEEFVSELEWINPYVMSISITADNQLWLGTKYGGVHGYSLETGEQIIFNTSSEDGGRLETDFAWPVLEAQNGILWLGMYGGGLHKVELPEGDPIDITNVEDSFILSVFEDRSGVIWVGTEDRGIYTLMPQQEFKDPNITFDDGFSLNETKVTALQSDTHGVTWLGTNRGLYRRDQPGAPFSLTENMPASVQVRGMYLDYGGTLWFTTNQGLFYSEDGSTISQKLPDPNLGMTDRIFAMIESTPGNYWISGNFGVVHWDSDIDEWTRFQHNPTDEESLSSNTASILSYSDGDIWIGTSNGGLNRLDLETGSIKRFTTSTHRSVGLESNRISDIKFDDDGLGWISTSDAGLFVFDTETESFEAVPLGDRASSSVIYNMRKVGNDRVLLATQAGLYSVDKAERQAEFVYMYGMNLSQVVERFFIDEDDNLFVAKDFGMLQISSLDNRENQKENLSVVLTDIAVGGESLTSSGFSTASNPLTFRYDDGSIMFEFALLDYSSPQENLFEYKVDGVYDEWVSLGNRNSINYVSLDPQDYTILVRGISPNGVASSDVLSIPLVVTPPFWQTLWFRSLIFMGLMLVIYSAYRYRLHHMLREERARLQIARDLHDEISSTLSSINFFSEAIDKSKIVDEKSRHFLNLIGNSSFEAKEKISDIIWVTHPENDSWETFIIKCKRKASDLLETREIEHEFSASGDFPSNITLPVKKNAWLIYREILANCVKHAEADFVKIAFHVHRSEISCEISDNGIGFDPENISSDGYGIDNIKSRIKELNGSFDLSSSDNGTQWKITFPI